VDAGVAREIEAAVQEALALFGTSGSVVVSGRQIELRGRGAPVGIDLELLGEQWSLLPADMRARKASELARRLVQAQRVVSSLAPPPGDGEVRSPRSVIIPAAVFALVVVGLLAGVRLLRSHEQPAPSPSAPSETAEEAAGRHARACEAARKRIYAGASMGPFEVEGWVAELWLATSRAGGATQADAGSIALSAEAAGLGALIAHGKLTPGADAELAALPDGAVELGQGLSDQDAARSPSWRAIMVRMSGDYARGYFDPALRARFISLADRMADAAGADFGALYARCAHLPHHDVGAWFRGPDAAGAATALVYGAGFFTELPAVDRGAVAALRGAGQLDALRSAGAVLDAAALGRLVGSQGGGLTVGAAEAVAITFPIGGPTRATAASRVVARKLGVGVGQD
jgi:hypothetical protein